MITYNQWGIPQEVPKRSLFKDFKKFWSLAALAALLTGCGGGDPQPIAFTATAYEHIDVGRMYRYEDGTLIVIGSLEPGKEGVSTVCEVKPLYYVNC